MKQTVNVLAASMKTINKNTLAVVSTSGTTMTSNSSQYIYFKIKQGMLNYRSYKSIKVRFKQEGTSIVLQTSGRNGCQNPLKETTSSE